MIQTTVAAEGLEPGDAEKMQGTNAAVRKHGYGTAMMKGKFKLAMGPSSNVIKN